MMSFKKLFLCGCAGALLVAPPLCLVSCSDDDEVVEKNEGEDTQGTWNKALEIIKNTSTGPQTVSEVIELGVLTCVNYANGDLGPIGVTPAVLNGEEVTLVTLGGTEFEDGQATTIDESTLAAYGESNDYIKAVVKLFNDGTVPQSKPVVVTGISLGGMIAQQVLGAQSIMDNFKIKAVITFGSPITLPLDRHQVKVVRFADTHDLVPILGESVLRMGKLEQLHMTPAELKVKLAAMDKEEQISRTGKYTHPVETHVLSYIDDECWSGTDFLGDPAKSNVLELTGSMTFYPAPKVEVK